MDKKGKHKHNRNIYKALRFCRKQTSFEDHIIQMELYKCKTFRSAVLL